MSKRDTSEMDWFQGTRKRVREYIDSKQRVPTADVEDLLSCITLLMSKEVGARIATIRTQRGLSKSELARRAIMSAADVGKIEQGRTRPYESQLRKIAVVLGVQPADLLDAGVAQ